MVGEESAQFVLQLPSDLRIIEAAVTYLVARCRMFAFAGSRLNLNFRVGVTEALANAVLYGNGSDPGKLVRVEVLLTPRRVVLDVVDEGAGFDPAEVPDPRLPGNIDKPGGRGLFLIHELMDEVEYSSRGNAVRLVLDREDRSKPEPAEVAAPGRESTAPALPASITEIFSDFRRAHGLDAWLWLRNGDGWRVAAGTSLPTHPGPGAFSAPASVGEETEARVEVGGADERSEALATFLAGLVNRYVRHEAEASFFGRELAERYEEITLLYSISEILGSVISLREAADTILSEVVETLGVRHATLWVHNQERDELELIAAVGNPGQTDPIPIADECSVTASVFRDRQPIILEPGDEFPRGECAPERTDRDSFLSVPVSYTPPEGESRTIGVINLVGLTGGKRFSAGDQKLISAIASQIGAAVENSRLVAASLRQERVVRELELAHDLQLKLLPRVDQFAGIAEVAARCVPAESVGGDFYHLFRLPGGRFGVMIGDVSSHGFSAALIMALTMSAVAIHASEGESPGEVLRRVHKTLVTELESTEMYLTLFYGVLDPPAGQITYANAGHSHAFKVTADGESTRLSATSPPLGLLDETNYDEASVSWTPEADSLFLFTDGLADALGMGEVEGSRALVEAVEAHPRAPLPELLETLFGMRVDPDAPADDRTAVLVRI